MCLPRGGGGGGTTHLSRLHSFLIFISRLFLRIPGRFMPTFNFTNGRVFSSTLSNITPPRLLTLSHPFIYYNI